MRGARKMRWTVVLVIGVVGAGLAAACVWHFAGRSPPGSPALSSRAPGAGGIHGAGRTAQASPPRQNPAIPQERTAGAGPLAIQLRDVTDDSGIGFVHSDGSSGKYYILETITAGLATFDYDGDGLIDIYFPNGEPLRGAFVDKLPRHALYRNLGNWKFRDATDEAGVICNAHGLGVAVGDYDNDGRPDLYLNNHRHNVLWHNNGNGTFTDVTQRAGVERKDKVGAGANFLDFDGDGNLDLFVAAYVKFSYERHRSLPMRGRSLYPGPHDHPTESSDLFHNRGDGTFANVSDRSGIGRHQGTGMGTVVLDYDRDGHSDIYVANDEIANFLFCNDGAGKFEESAIPTGAAFNAGGLPQGSMGADCGDFDHDGWLDLLVTSFQTEGGALYQNSGGVAFLEVAQPMRLAHSLMPQVSWGCAIVDLDNDGDRDLFIACGHTDPNANVRDSGSMYKAPCIVMENLLVHTGKLQFVDITDLGGDGLKVLESHRGAAFDDLDNDGDIDVVILNSRTRPTILRNMLFERGSKNHWLAIQLRGAKTSRDGVGAQVAVTAGKLRQIDEVHSGRGYQSHFGSRLHFGLGGHDRVDRIEVRWIGGGVDVWENVDVNRLLVIHEGAGSPPR